MNIIKEYEKDGLIVKIVENGKEMGYQIFKEGNMIAEDFDEYSEVDIEYIEFLADNYDIYYNEKTL